MHALIVFLSTVTVNAGLHAADDGLDLEPYRGKVVHVDFWASWCAPCRASFPWMNALLAELGDEGLVVLGVNTGDTPEEAALFLERVPADFEIVYDADGAIASALGLEGMPAAPGGSRLRASTRKAKRTSSSPSFSRAHYPTLVTSPGLPLPTTVPVPSTRGRSDSLTGDVVFATGVQLSSTTCSKPVSRTLTESPSNRNLLLTSTQ